MEADLNEDPTDEFVTEGQRKGTGHEWTGACNCCGANFTGHKHKLIMNIAGKKFVNKKEMNAGPSAPASLIIQGDQHVPTVTPSTLVGLYWINNGR